jgi:abequosyltransferase
MMPKLLTVAVPTYNRAGQLDRQLGWLDRNLAGFESACDVILSDNASTDDTPSICATWRETLAARGVDCRINRNAQNLGPLPNIARYVDASAARFIWAIGDDDHIPDGTLAWLIQRLRADPSLASVVLNFNSVGKTVYDRCFQFPADQIGHGREVISECLRQAYVGLAFMTAQVYRTEFAQAALRAWPEGTKNWDFQVFLTAYTGLQGRVLATRDTHLTYVTGDNIYEKDKRVGLTLYADSLEVFVRVHRIGYGTELCRRLARSHLWALKRRFVSGALKNNPLRTLVTIARIAKYLVQLEIPRPVLRAPGGSRRCG